MVPVALHNAGTTSGAQPLQGVAVSFLGPLPSLARLGVATSTPTASHLKFALTVRRCYV